MFSSFSLILNDARAFRNLAARARSQKQATQATPQVQTQQVRSIHHLPQQNFFLLPAPIPITAALLDHGVPSSTATALSQAFMRAASQLQRKTRTSLDRSVATQSDEAHKQQIYLVYLKNYLQSLRDFEAKTINSAVARLTVKDGHGFPIKTITNPSKTDSFLSQSVAPQIVSSDPALPSSQKVKRALVLLPSHSKPPLPSPSPIEDKKSRKVEQTLSLPFHGEVPLSSPIKAKKKSSWPFTSQIPSYPFPTVYPPTESKQAAAQPLEVQLPLRKRLSMAPPSADVSKPDISLFTESFSVKLNILMTDHANVRSGSLAIKKHMTDTQFRPRLFVPSFHSSSTTNKSALPSSLESAYSVDQGSFHRKSSAGNQAPYFSERKPFRSIASESRTPASYPPLNYPDFLVGKYYQTWALPIQL